MPLTTSERTTACRTGRIRTMDTDQRRGAVENRAPPALQDGAAALENGLATPLKSEAETHVQPGNSAPGILPNRNTTVSTRTQAQRYLRCPNTGERMHKTQRARAGRLRTPDSGLRAAARRSGDAAAGTRSPRGHPRSGRGRARKAGARAIPFV